MRMACWGKMARLGIHSGGDVWANGGQSVRDRAIMVVMCERVVLMGRSNEGRLG